MLKKIYLNRTVQQDLESFLDSGGRLEPLDQNTIDSMAKKARYFLKYGKYPKQKA